MHSRESVFRAVGDPRRRLILEWLREGELTAGEIARRADVSWPAVSRHLAVLKLAGLVMERREGRERRYSLVRGRLRLVVGGWIASLDLRYGEGHPAIDPPSPPAPPAAGLPGAGREDWS